ncbi:MAG: hypothetical protein FJY88_05555 [Candidatus Eisenbacteria bacterium]|nr:hypothetical protein [Candidatus Eisenbacteria bacterium]
MRRGRVVLPLAVLCVAGCAATKPCMIIPAQIELAMDTRNYAQQAYDAKKADLDRWLQNVEQSRSKLARLMEDREELLRETAAEGGSAKEGSAGGSK